MKVNRKSKSKAAKHIPTTEGDHDKTALVPTDMFQESEKDSYKKTRIGIDYQADIPYVIPEPGRKVHVEYINELLIWRPSKKLSENKTKFEDYLSMAKDRNLYSTEQALGLLFWHRNDIQRATHDLDFFIPCINEWTKEDKLIFEKAFEIYGKNFTKIKLTLPEKSMSSLISFYYNWRDRKSEKNVKNRHEKNLGLYGDGSGKWRHIFGKGQELNSNASSNLQRGR